VVNLPEDLKDVSIDMLDPALDTQLQAAIAVFSQQAQIPKTANR
jgi:hypothetical protein